MKFFFYSKHDKSKEPIGSIPAEDEKQAVKFFSQLKGLSIEKFLSIFRVKKLK